MTEKSSKPKRLKPVPKTHPLWRKYAADAEDAGRLDLLSELCRLDCRLREIRREIHQDGLTGTTIKGRALAHPLLSLEATFSTMYSRLLRVVTAPIRGRGRPSKDELDSNELARFRKKRIAEHAIKPN